MQIIVIRFPSYSSDLGNDEIVARTNMPLRIICSKNKKIGDWKHVDIRMLQFLLFLNLISRGKRFCTSFF